jgi:TPP-dependent pyruvate/acetoin dehydrogenase alpha subunit
LGVMSKKQIDVVHAAVDKDIEEAVEYANDSPYPTEDQLLENVYYVKGA